MAEADLSFKSTVDVECYSPGQKFHQPPPRWIGLHSGCSQIKSCYNGNEQLQPCSEVHGPHLVNYGLSRINNSVNFIQLPDFGQLVVGAPDRDKPPDISIDGSGVEPEHAILACLPGEVTLIPYASMTMVDGIRCMEPQLLKRGSMLCFGRSHYFKYMCPVGYIPKIDQESQEFRNDCDATNMGQPQALDNPEYFQIEQSHDSRQSTGNECHGTTATAKLSDSQEIVKFPQSSGYILSEEHGVSDEQIAYIAQTGSLKSPLPPPLHSSLAQKVVAKPPQIPSASPCLLSVINPSPYDNVPVPKPRLVNQQNHTSQRYAEYTELASANSNFTTDNSVEQPLPKQRFMVEDHSVSQPYENMEPGKYGLQQFQLDDIISVCTEYQDQVTFTNSVPKPSGSLSPCHIRIKTNGSLPRESSTSYSNPGSPTILVPASPLNSISYDAMKIPYENVPLPQSPRTRIRTTLQRDQSPCSPYQVPPSPVPVTTSASVGSAQYSNSEYMTVGTAEAEFQIEDRIFLPGTAGRFGVGYVNDAVDVETLMAMEEDAITLHHSSGVNNAVYPIYNESDRHHGVSHNLSLENAPLPSPHKASLESGMACHVYIPKSGMTDSVASKSVIFHHPKNQLETDREMEICIKSGTVTTMPIISFSSTVSTSKMDMYEKLKDEKLMCYREISELRGTKLELEHQESEAIRQLEVEYALLDGEVETCLAHLQKLVELVNEQRESLASSTQKWSEQQRLETREMGELAVHIVAAEEKLDDLKSLLQNVEGCTDKEHDLLQKLKKQQELVEQGRKIYEDKEFHHMESAAGWDTAKEDMVHEITDYEKRISEAKDKIETVRNQQRSLIEAIRVDADGMEQRRKEVLRQMCTQRDKLRKMHRQLRSLSLSGFEDTVQDGKDADETELSSDTDFLCNDYIESRLAQLNMIGKSCLSLNDVLDVTSSSSRQIGHHSTTLLKDSKYGGDVKSGLSGGARQDGEVIECEHQRVEELKRRVHEDVASHWEERKRRELNCQSLNSIGSDESPASGTSDPTADPSGSEPDRVTISSGPDASSQRQSRADEGGECTTCDLRQRPASDVSSAFDGVEEPPTLRRRPSAAPQQRPLTRYLPISTADLDLRQHIESAGHQLETCSSLQLSSHVCRGQLHKLSSRFKTWQRRWFVFDRSRNKCTFMYYGDKSESKLKGGVYFRAIEEVYVDHLKTGVSTTFCVKTMRRVYHLMALSPEAMRIWVDVIMTGAEGYNSFRHG